jgi:hypothetical protein
MISEVTGGFSSLFDDVNVATPFKQVNNSIANITFVISSLSGSLEYYGFTATNDVNTVSVNTSGSVNGGTGSVSLNITPSINHSVIVTYFLKSTTRDSVTQWTTTYFVTDFDYNSTSITGGLFDEVQSLDQPLKGIIGFFIVLMLTIIFISTTRDFSTGVIGGIIGLGICYFVGLLPTNLIIVSAIVLVILLIGDNFGGGV